MAGRDLHEHAVAVRGVGTRAVATRAREWRNGAHAAICDVIEPWEHGTVARATSHPNYFDFNVVRVEDDPGMTVEELAAVADRALAGLSHRRVDFDLVQAAEPLRAAFYAAGWSATRLLWMRHEGSRSTAPDVAVERVPDDEVEALRTAWHREDFPNHEPAEFQSQRREVAVRLQTEVIAVREAGEPVAFAELERRGTGVEIGSVYVDRKRRGEGLGTALTMAAIERAGDARDLWIVADDEHRPKHLYSRLGFRPVWTAMEFLRIV